MFNKSDLRKILNTSFYVLSSFIFQIFSLLTFYIIINNFNDQSLNEYFFLTSLVAILVGGLFLGNDKLFLYTKDKFKELIYFNNLIKICFFTFITFLLISILINSKLFIFISLNFILISINYFSELNFLKHSFKYRMILFKYLPVIFFFILSLLLKLDMIFFGLLIIFTFANFLAATLNFFLNEKFLYKFFKIKINFYIKFSDINKNSLIIWIGDILSLLIFHLPTIFFYFLFPYENVIYNIIHKFGFIPVFLISFAISKIFDYDYFDNNKSSMFDAFSKTRILTFIISILYSIFFLIFINFFGSLIFGEYSDQAIPIIIKYVLLFFILINSSSLSTIFLINKNYKELLLHQIFYLLIMFFSLTVAYIKNDFNYFIDLFFYFSILRGIVIYISIYLKINSYRLKV